MGSVLIELLAHWGYENDPVVVAEVLAALERGAPGRWSGSALTAVSDTFVGPESVPALEG